MQISEKIRFKYLKNLDYSSFFIFFSLYLGNFYYKVFVTIKPFMVILAFLLAFRIFYRKKIDLVLDKVLITYIVYSSVFIFVSSNSYNPKSSLILVMALCLVLCTLVIFRSELYGRLGIGEIELSGQLFVSLSIVLYVCGCVYLMFNPEVTRGTVFGAVRDRGMIRFAGLVGNCNYFSAFLLPYIYLFLIRNIKWFYISLICLFLTFSFSAIFSFIVGYILYYLILKQRNIKKDLSSAFILLGAFLWFTTFITQLIPSELIDTFFVRIFSALKGSGRFEMWNVGLKFLKDSPFWGIGVNNLQIITTKGLGIVNIHSSFLEVLIEGGGVTFLIFMLLISFMLYESIKISKSKKELSWLFPALTSALLNLMFVSATVNSSLILIFLIFFAIKDNEYNVNNKKLVEIEN